MYFWLGGGIRQGELKRQHSRKVFLQSVLKTCLKYCQINILNGIL